jgi:hypothetical protein
MKTTVGLTTIALTAGSARNATASQSSSKILEPGRIEISNPSKFRILQFTDVHFFSGRTAPWSVLNQQTIEILNAINKRQKPDLIMITGDLWRDNPMEMTEEFMRFGVEQCEALGVPWAFAWGNHDQLPDFSLGHKALSNAKNSLYAGSGSDGNYVLDAVDSRGKTACQLLCLNSKRKGLGESQQQWMSDLAKNTGVGVAPRFAFFHIPLKQYVDVWDSGAAVGFRAEAPCKELEDGASFKFLKELGVKACFCGHDHVNDYAGIIDGVELAYGRATGVGGYGARDLAKGAKLITVNCETGTYKWETVLPDGSRWRPKPGERIVKTKTT